MIQKPSMIIYDVNQAKKVTVFNLNIQNVAR